jgi:D123
MSDTRDGSVSKMRALPFPPLKKSHILNCSYHSWHPRYRAFTPKARLIPLTTPFLDYLRADGIVLPHDQPTSNDRGAGVSDADSGIFSEEDADSDSDGDEEDPAAEWRDLHNTIEATIHALGGKAIPKLNWSAPKDATWINASGTMECQSAEDVYLLLKSSNFVTHDLEHAFDGCVDADRPDLDDVPYFLVLRKYFQLNPSVEFRCFVKERKLIGICQRELNYFEFLSKMETDLRNIMVDFFESKLRDTFPDESFTFDVYIPPPHNQVWLIDINPWAIRTDPLLFSWLELLTMDVGEIEDDDSDAEAEAGLTFPELRLIKRDDPEAYNFSTQQYGAHKLPKDVVDASRVGGAQLREMADQWRELIQRMDHSSSQNRGN